MTPLQQSVKCNCGKVNLAIDSPSVIRLVCYCRDCRGYINTLNEKAQAPACHLDKWGGTDWTSIYPDEITVTKGKEELEVCKIRDRSGIRRVYAKCCYTPMFNIGDLG